MKTRLRRLRIVSVILFGATAHAQGELPYACTVVTLADVTSAVGAGYARMDLRIPASSSEVTSCLYTKDPATSVSVTLIPAPNGDGKGTVTGRQQLERLSGKTVSAVPDVCDAAFSIVNSFFMAFVTAGRGPWQMNVLVVTGGRPDIAAAAKVAKAACSHFP